MRYSKSDYDNYDKTLCYGRIRSYTKSKGYGFIETENGKDLFLSSFHLAKKNHEKYLYVGSVVSFFITQMNGKFCAVNVNIVERMPSCEEICIGNHKIDVRGLADYGLSDDKVSYMWFRFQKGEELRIMREQIKMEILDLFNSIHTELCRLKNNYAEG